MDDVQLSSNPIDPVVLVDKGYSFVSEELAEEAIPTVEVIENLPRSTGRFATSYSFARRSR